MHRPSRRERPVWIVESRLIAEDLAAVPDPEQKLSTAESGYPKPRKRTVGTRGSAGAGSSVGSLLSR